jgi:hypothetical protein
MLETCESKQERDVYKLTGRPLSERACLLIKGWLASLGRSRRRNRERASDGRLLPSMMAKAKTGELEPLAPSRGFAIPRPDDAHVFEPARSRARHIRAILNGTMYVLSTKLPVVSGEW